MVLESKINMALIGLGSIAQKAYLPILANHPKVNPILCTRNIPTLQKLSSQYRIDTTFSDLEELIKAKPDAAMVHSATESHPIIVSKLLNAKIPVFVDKPLSYHLTESEKILNLATKHQLPLFLGFNRRYAPLIKMIANAPNPVQIVWQKNRVDLPGDPRVFVLDDFIHVIDSLRFLGKGDIQNLNVVARVKDQQLENIQVQWEQEDTLLVGGMNRISGATEEQVTYYTKGNKWVINDLNTGVHFSQNKEQRLHLDSWATTLYKRGFVDMMEDWISIVEKNVHLPDSIDDIWKTHQLCEKILGTVS